MESGAACTVDSAAQRLYFPCSYKGSRKDGGEKRGKGKQGARKGRDDGCGEEGGVSSDRPSFLNLIIKHKKVNLVF